MKLPNIAISIRQPWAWLILYGGKDIENRSWPTRFRGPVLIHAAKGMTAEEYEGARQFTDGACLARPWPTIRELERGGIVGVAEIVDCVTASDSLWFVGEYGFVIRGARPLPFHPCKGALGFFRCDYPEANQ